MKALDKYFKLQEEIYKYFGYVEDWVAFPIDDRREYWWRLQGKVFLEGVEFSKTKTGLIDKSDDYYVDSIYKQRFLSKWVYEGKDYTMICVDTQTDGNKFLAIYDNKKKVED